MKADKQPYARDIRKVLIEETYCNSANVYVKKSEKYFLFIKYKSKISIGIRIA